MTAIQLLACAGLVTGVFMILGLKPTEVTDGICAFLIGRKGAYGRISGILPGVRSPDPCGGRYWRPRACWR